MSTTSKFSTAVATVASGSGAAGTALVSSGGRVALALGGGGARGLAHIVALEAFDELGIRPHLIAGTSIGAIFGAAYASGLSARHIRSHAEELLAQRFDLIRQLFSARAEPVWKLLSFMPVRNALLDAPTLLEAVLPSGVARTFEALQIPLRIVTCDFYAQSEVVHSEGDLRTAVAGSMALPVLFAPVLIGGRAHVDGGFVNPLPFDVVSERGDITVAIDVSGGVRDAGGIDPGTPAQRIRPSATEILTSSSQILQRSIVREKLKARQPDVLIEAPVDQFTVVDFHRWREILQAAEPLKDELKRHLDRVLSSETLPLLPSP